MKNQYGKVPSVQTLKQNDLSWKLLMMNYFLVLLIFVSMEDIIVNKDAENMFIQNMVDIITLKRSLKVFPSLNTRNNTYKLPQSIKDANVSKNL